MRARDPAARDSMVRCAGQLAAFEAYAPGAWAQRARDARKRSCLAGAVRTDQRRKLAVRYVQIELLERAQRPEAFRQAAHLEQNRFVGHVERRAKRANPASPAGWSETISKINAPYSTRSRPRPVPPSIAPPKRANPT